MNIIHIRIIFYIKISKIEITIFQTNFGLFLQMSEILSSSFHQLTLHHGFDVFVFCVNYSTSNNPSIISAYNVFVIVTHHIRCSLCMLVYERPRRKRERNNFGTYQPNPIQTRCNYKQTRRFKFDRWFYMRTYLIIWVFCFFTQFFSKNFNFRPIKKICRNCLAQFQLIFRI